MASIEVDKRSELIHRAIEVFSARGYRATSMQDLADQVNLSKPTLYHYFKSKQDLLVGIYNGVMEENLAATKRIANDDQPVVESLRQMLFDRVSYTCHNHRILQIFHEEEAELPPRSMKRVTESRRAYQMVMTGLLERGLNEGLFEFSATPMLVANTLLGACNWSYKWYNPAGPKTPEELAAEIADFLMFAVLPSRQIGELETAGRRSHRRRARGG